MKYPIDDLPVREANKKDILSLLEIIPDVIPNSTERTSPENLRWLLNRSLDEIETLPLDKLNRWIGFVHGVLSLSGHLDVDTKRNTTRADYHAAYLATGQVIPETKNLEDTK